RDFHVTGVQTCALPISDGGDAVGAGVDVDADGGVGADGQRRAEARIGLAGHVSPSVLQDLRALSSSRWTDAGESRTWRATARTGSEPGGAEATMSAMAEARSRATLRRPRHARGHGFGPAA